MCHVGLHRPRIQLAARAHDAWQWLTKELVGATCPVWPHSGANWRSFCFQAMMSLTPSRVLRRPAIGVRRAGLVRWDRFLVPRPTPWPPSPDPSPWFPMPGPSHGSWSLIRVPAGPATLVIGPWYLIRRPWSLLFRPVFSFQSPPREWL